MDLAFQELNLNQLVDCYIWDRSVNNQGRQLILDHTFCVNPLKVDHLYKIHQTFDDYLLLVFKLCSKLRRANCSIEDNDMQGYWNCLENFFWGGWYNCLNQYIWKQHNFKTKYYCNHRLKLHQWKKCLRN